MPVAIPVLGAVFYEPLVRVTRTIPGNASVPRTVAPLEKNGLNTQIGVPLKLGAGGFVQECDFAAADVVYAVSLEPGHNLTASGTAQAGLSEYAPPNQPAGLIIPVGSHIRLGTLTSFAADGLTVFSAALKYTTLPNLGANPPVPGVSQIYTPALQIPGVFYGLVKDATSGFWFIDITVTNGNNAVCQIIDVDPSSPNDGVNGTRVFFQFKPAQRFFQ